MATDVGRPIILPLGVRREPSSHYYVYVDNLGVISLDKKRVVDAMKDLQSKFNRLGLELHGAEVGSDSIEALGCVLDGRDMQSRLTSNRL